jgi:hypothetical protein
MLERCFDAIYCLPEEAIRSLSVCQANKGPLLDEAQIAAEIEFARLCRYFHAVGVFNGKFIANNLLNPRPGLDASWMRSFGWSESIVASLMALVRDSDSIAERALGYVGWLQTEPDFLNEIEALRTQWLGLPTRKRPSFPISRWLTTNENRDDQVLSGDIEIEARCYRDAILRFLDKWQLMYLATWDLPAPQGPHMPTMLPRSSPAFPRQSVHFAVPTYYPLQANDNLTARVTCQQVQAAREAGVEITGASLQHAEAYAQIAMLIHLELAIRSRFDRPPPGLVARIVRAAAGVLGVCEAQVKRYREDISRCRRGQRHGIKRLTVKARVSC